MRRQLVQFFLLAFIPAAAFLCAFNPAILDPGNVGWLLQGTDLGENALGMQAYLHDPTAGWATSTQLLNHPDGTTLLFTDSNPLLGLLLKPFAAMLPSNFQIVGPWLLFCCMMQALFAWAILRPHAPGFLALWCGVALCCALPTWFNRFPHSNLFAHFLILWALWVFIEPLRANKSRWWLPPLVISALIHSYLLIMVAAIWGSAVMAQFLTVRGSGAIAVQWRMILSSLGIVAMLGGIALWQGAGEAVLPTGSYGAFAMPIDALWNPANSGYGHLMPAIAQREGRGFEGYQYLGLGILLLLGTAALAWRTQSVPVTQATGLGRLRWLLPAFVVLTLLAISSFPDIAGTPLPRLALPDAAIDALDLVRASGRLFWPVAYTMVVAAILCVYRLGAAQSARLLAVLLAIQLVDLRTMLAVVRKQSAAASDPVRYRRTVDLRWEQMIKSARDVSFVPADATLDLALFQEVAWRAVSIQRPVRLAYTARTSLRTQARLLREAADFAAGRLAPDRLYVLLPSAAVPSTAAARLVTLDGVRVIAPVKQR